MAMVRKILNFSEEALELKLRNALKNSKCRVFASVNMRNVLDISSAQLTCEELELAKKSDFDFVVAESDSTPIFAVEFDGPVHQRKVKIIIDNTKNSICEKCDFPILRIDEDLLHRKVDNFDLVEWLVELYFICREFYRMQEQGIIPPNEPWYYGSLIGFDPFIRWRAIPFKWQQQRKIRSAIPYEITSVQDDNYYCSLTAYEIIEGQWIVGEARCRVFKFDAIPASELSEELSMIVAVERTKAKLSGASELLWTSEKLKKHVNSLKSRRHTEAGRRFIDL
jgi:hypothetical protein